MADVTYTARDYSPGKVRKRYVRRDVSGAFRWCEVGDDRRFDLRQGIVAESEIPPLIIQKAIEASKSWPCYVEWPL